MEIKSKLFKTMFMVIGIACLLACSEKSDETPSGPVGTKSLQVTPSKLTFTAAGGSQQLQVKTSYQYYGYDIPAEWLSGSFKDDPTYNYVVITADPNTKPEARSATIKITGSNSESGVDEYVMISVEQEGSSSSGEMEYTTVSKSGGEVSAEDMTISFPANTFESDTSVGMVKAESGSVRGDDEVSTFYTIELPADTKQSFKVSIKGDQSDDVQMIAHAPSVSLDGNMQQSESDVVLEATYSNGAYVAEIPAFDNNGESGNTNVSFGLVKKGRSTQSARTRGTTNDPSITFYLDWSRKYDWSLEAQETIEDAATDAINTILSLGFKVTGARNIPIVIKALSEEGAYGYFMQSAISEKWSTIEINSKMLNGNKDELRQTVFHEMLHYFQSAYDPRCCFSKYRFVYRDLLMLSEAGGVWIEKLAGSGYSNIMKQNADGVMRSFDPVKEIYKGTPNEGREYQAHGYGLGIVLEYLSQEKGDNSIVCLYQAQKDGAATTKECFQKFNELAGFDFFYNYDDFAIRVLTGEVIDGFGFANVRESSHLTLADDKVQTVSGKAYPYGTKVKQIRIDKGYKDSKGSNSMKNMALIVEEKKQYVNTYVYLQNKDNKKGKELGHFFPGETFLFDDEKVLEKSLDGNTYYYLVTMNTTNISAEDSELEVALAEVKIPNITKVAISYGFTDTAGDPHYTHIPVRSSNDYNSGILYVDQWAPCTTSKNLSDKTITITSSGSMSDGSNYGVANPTQTWEISLTIDVSNWGIKDYYDVKGSVRWKSSGTETSSFSEEKYSRNISFNVKKVSLLKFNDDDTPAQYHELGMNFSPSELFSNYSDTYSFTRNVFATETSEGYTKTEDKTYTPDGSTIPFSIHLWEEDN